MGQLILLRHGQSVWNALNLFTGWIDIPLSTAGIEEALRAGREIAHLPIDVVFTSSLCRAQMTALLALSVHESAKVPAFVHEGHDKVSDWSKNYSHSPEAECLPVYTAWQLNERMYGELQGLNKAETIEKYGAEQVQLWRRSFDVPPPGGESLEMTAARTLPYFKEKVLPLLQAGKNVLIAAHGNSLRSIVMWLDSLSKEQILRFELATGIPLLYNYDGKNFQKTTISANAATHLPRQ